MEPFKSLKDHVYHYISEKINDGSLLPETKINEKMIIDDLDISRTPVREALIQLAAQGYLENIPRRGFIVKQVDSRKAKEVYGLLGVLEGYAASLAADMMEQGDIRKLKDLYAKMKTSLETDDVRAYYAFQNQFHDVYIEKSGNRELIKQIRLLKRIFIRQTYTTKAGEPSLKKVLEETNADHKTIIDLFEKKEAAKLEQYLRHHHWNPALAGYDTV